MSNLTLAPHYSSRSHSPASLRDLVRLYVKAIKTLQRVLPAKINCLVASGTSGVPLLGAVSFATNMPALVIRRSSKETSRDPSMVVGTIPQVGARYLFIDDLISSGETIFRCHKAIAEVTKTMHLPPARCMAAGLYYGSAGTWGVFREIHPEHVTARYAINAPFPIVRVDENPTPASYTTPRIF